VHGKWHSGRLPSAAGRDRLKSGRLHEAPNLLVLTLTVLAHSCGRQLPTWCRRAYLRRLLNCWLRYVASYVPAYSIVTAWLAAMLDVSWVARPSKPETISSSASGSL
jgi:hypothetical protein